MIYEFLIEPFLQPQMKFALAASIAIALGSAPLGVFLVLRRMSLAGDTLSHGIFPGVAIAYITAGASFWAMTIGGIIAGVAVTVISLLVRRSTSLKEDATFAGAYIISLALGVAIISANGGDDELIHMLFGDALAIDKRLLVYSTLMASFSLIGLSLIYRPLVVESVDPVFMKSVKGYGAIYHQIFLLLLVLNLVAAFQALGTLMAVGIMILPAISARLWTNNIDRTILASMIFALTSAIGGLLLSYHANIPSGPSTALVGGGFYIFSIIFGHDSGLIRKVLPHHHLAE